MVLIVTVLVSGSPTGQAAESKKNSNCLMLAIKGKAQISARNKVLM